MKKIRSAFLGLLGLSVVLVLAVGCYRPAAPEMTPTSAGGAEAATPGEVPDIEATAIARSTLSAATMAAQTPAGEGEATEEPTEAAPTATPEPTTPPPPADTPAPTSAPTATPAPPVTGATTHVVRPGENMFRIALRYGTTVDAIARANGIANPQMIYVGQELTIPGAGDQPSQPAPGAVTYVTVQPGDNLFRIALRYGMDYRYLAQYNGIPYPYNISVGQIIKIPPR